MQFKKVDVLISENLTKEQLKEKVLTELNKISKESNPSISYIANIHDIVNGKYWICMDSETKETMGAEDELIDLQAIFRHTTENPEEASKDLLYSSKYIEDNFLRKIIFETYKESNDSRLNKLETTVDTNEKDIEDKHYKLEKRVSTAENNITDNRKLEDTRYDEYTQFKKDIENNILSINNNLNTKANLGGSETQVFNVADPTSDWHAINLAYAKKNFNVDLINAHTADFNNPHRTTVSNLTDTTITNPQRNQVLAYNGTKWINKDLSLDDSNYAKKNEANIFTKKQSGIDGTEDANFVTLRQLKTKVGLTGNETIAGVKTFSSSIVIPNATANNHSLPLGQADNRYSKLLTENLEWTVGTGGKFTNLNDALSEALKYNKSNIITIKLKSGFVFNEKIVFSNANFNNVIIRSEDAIVKVNPNNAVFSDTSVNYLFLSNYSITPIIDIKVDLNPSKNSNSTKKIVFLGLYQNSRGIIAENKGCMNAVWDAIMVEQASTLFADSCVIENAGCDGVFCSHGSIVNISHATIKGTARYGILARFGGYVAANKVKLIDQTRGTLLHSEGGIIYAHELVTTGSTATETNITPNQLASNGIIFK
ncbi:hypothetical protein GKB13_08145 [Campylobacter coli]|nr:hypothetical protein [Campylobacter coli]